MCSFHTEGTQHGCGHYVITKRVEKIDCRNQYCVHSRQHRQPCPHCPQCRRYYDPDSKETITRKTNDFCSECEYWYHGEGAKRR